MTNIHKTSVLTETPEPVADWPGWLSDLVVWLHGEKAGVSDELTTANAWFRGVVAATLSPATDYAAARHRFMVATLRSVVAGDRTGAV